MSSVHTDGGTENTGSYRCHICVDPPQIVDNRPASCATERGLRQAGSCYLPEEFVGGLSRHSAVWSIVVVVGFGFPLIEAFYEEVRIVDDFAFEQSVDLVRIDTVRSFRLADQACGLGADLDVSDT